MNCFSASCATGRRQFCLLLACFLSFAACGEATPRATADSSVYQVHYAIEVLPDNAAVVVRLSLRQDRHLLREMTMTADPLRVTEIRGDGEIEADDDEITWRPPENGGSIEWRVDVNHRRNDGGYDAWLGPDWGLFRAEDIIPRARTRTLKSSTSETTVAFRLPASWSVVSEYFVRDNQFAVRKAERRFDQPSGWMVLGDLGVRRDEIANTRVAVAAPQGQSVRRLEMLALLRWTLPELARVLPSLPRRLTIVSAGEPMWRGALSAPASLFVHADRPLISENATSTLLHEVVHVTARFDTAPGHDWIAEGIAEYYSLEMLYRSGTISSDRYLGARKQLADWAKQADTLCADAASGPVTALAVTVLAKLDEELRSASDGSTTLDDLVSKLVDAGKPADVALVRNIAEQLAGKNIETLHTDKLPGCRNITAVEQ